MVYTSNRFFHYGKADKGNRHFCCQANMNPGLSYSLDIFDSYSPCSILFSFNIIQYSYLNILRLGSCTAVITIQPPSRKGEKMKKAELNGCMYGLSILHIFVFSFPTDDIENKNNKQSKENKS